MKKWTINILISANIIFLPSLSLATTFTCPILLPNEVYFNLDWVQSNGQRIANGAWNKDQWRIWINGDSYLTPKELPVITTPLAAHYFASTNTWYLKCTSADLNVGPRNNVGPYTSCNATATGFDCENPIPNIPVTTVGSPASSITTFP
jgi:hypothetical protein